MRHEAIDRHWIPPHVNRFHTVYFKWIQNYKMHSNSIFNVCMLLCSQVKIAPFTFHVALFSSEKVKKKQNIIVKMTRNFTWNWFHHKSVNKNLKIAHPRLVNYTVFTLICHEMTWNWFLLLLLFHMWYSTCGFFFLPLINSILFIFVPTFEIGCCYFVLFLYFL